MAVEGDDDNKFRRLDVFKLIYFVQSVTGVEAEYHHILDI